jgi:hypothetical protein
LVTTKKGDSVTKKNITAKRGLSHRAKNEKKRWQGDKKGDRVTKKMSLQEGVFLPVQKKTNQRRQKTGA